MAKRREDYWGRFARTFDEDQKYIVGEGIQRTIIQKLSTERDLDKIERDVGAKRNKKKLDMGWGKK